MGLTMTYCPSGFAPPGGAALGHRTRRVGVPASFARFQFQLEMSDSKCLTNSQISCSSPSFVMCNRPSAAHTFAAKDEEDFENHV